MEHIIGYLNIRETSDEFFRVINNYSVPYQFNW